MFSTDGILAFHAWTENSYKILFEHAAKLPEHLFIKPVDGFGFPSVRDQLRHIAMCEEFWVSAAQGLSFERWDVAGFTNAGQIFTEYQRVAGKTRQWIASLSTEELLTPRRIEFSDGFAGLIAPAPMLHHVLTHGYHHKGQVVAMCRLLGYPPPETDLDLAVLQDA